MKTLKLAVIESRWWSEGNSSVKGLFDTLADIHTDNPGRYHYEMFNNNQSFREIVLRIGKSKAIKNLYIASHGNSRGIAGADGNIVSRAFIRNTLLSFAASKKAKLNGLYFGSCEVANKKTIEFLLKKKSGTHLKIKWVAGYSKTVDWIYSSAVDLCFWNTYYYRKRRETELEKISYVAKFMDQFMPGAHHDLGFNIFVRKQRVGGHKIALRQFR